MQCQCWLYLEKPLMRVRGQHQLDGDDDNVDDDDAVYYDTGARIAASTFGGQGHQRSVQHTSTSRLKWCTCCCIIILAVCAASVVLHVQQTWAGDYHLWWMARREQRGSWYGKVQSTCMIPGGAALALPRGALTNASTSSSTTTPDYSYELVTGPRSGCSVDHLFSITTVRQDEAHRLASRTARHGVDAAPPLLVFRRLTPFVGHLYHSIEQLVWVTSALIDMGLLSSSSGTIQRDNQLVFVDEFAPVTRKFAPVLDALTSRPVVYCCAPLVINAATGNELYAPTPGGPREPQRESPAVVDDDGVITGRTAQPVSAALEWVHTPPWNLWHPHVAIGWSSCAQLPWHYSLPTIPACTSRVFQTFAASVMLHVCGQEWRRHGSALDDTTITVLVRRPVTPSSSGSGNTKSGSDSKPEKPPTRWMLNLDQVRTRVTSAGGLPVRYLVTEGMPFLEQLQHMAATSVLVGAHGAGLMHALFLPPHSAVVELQPSNYAAYALYDNIARASGHSYVPFLYQRTAATVEEYRPVFGKTVHKDAPFTVDIPQLQSVLDAVVANIRQQRQQEGGGP